MYIKIYISRFRIHIILILYSKKETSDLSCIGLKNKRIDYFTLNMSRDKMDLRASKLGLWFWFSQRVLQSSMIIWDSRRCFRHYTKNTKRAEGCLLPLQCLLKERDLSQEASSSGSEWNQMWIHKLITATTKLTNWSGHPSVYLFYLLRFKLRVLLVYP